MENYQELIINYVQVRMKKFIFVLLVIILSISFSPSVVFATPQDDLDEIQKQLEEIAAKKDIINESIGSEQGIQNEIARELVNLKNQVDILGAEIEENELIIEQLNIQIEMLEEEIETAEEEITKAKEEISDLQDETDERFLQMYLEQKTFSQISMVFSTELTNLLKLELYQATVQQETNDLLAKLKTKKTALGIKKEKLADDKIQVQRDEVQVQEKKVALERDKSSLDSKRDIYYRKKQESSSRLSQQEQELVGVSKEEEYALAEQERLQQIIFDMYSAIPSGVFVTKGTQIGRQGCSGYCTGDHLHFGVKKNGNFINPCSALESNAICSGTGELKWPMSGTYYLTSGYGWRWGKMHYGLDLANSLTYAPIYAAHDGYLIRGKEGCNWSSWIPCNNGGANYVLICQDKNNCNAGFKSLYWHLAD